MTQDFAKKRADRAPRKAKEPRRTGSGWGWFASGFFVGAFLMFLAGLIYLSPRGPSTDDQAEAPAPEPEAKAEEMQWDFYEIFPKSVVPIVEEYTTSGQKIQADQYAWILQVGSFRSPDDADELRASLLLLGMDVTTATVTVEKTKWHRVLVGPFETELDRNRAQDRLAQAEVKAIPLRIPR